MSNNSNEPKEATESDQQEPVRRSPQPPNHSSVIRLPVITTAGTVEENVEEFKSDAMTNEEIPEATPTPTGGSPQASASTGAVLIHVPTLQYPLTYQEEPNYLSETFQISGYPVVNTENLTYSNVDVSEAEIQFDQTDERPNVIYTDLSNVSGSQNFSQNGINYLNYQTEQGSPNPVMFDDPNLGSTRSNQVRRSIRFCSRSLYWWCFVFPRPTSKRNR